MKILLTGAFPYNDNQLNEIKSLGYEITFVQDERIPIDFNVSDIEAVVCNGLFLYTPIEKFKNLKFIQLTSAGLDRVPLDYINEHEIKLFNARGVYSQPMAEFALCGVLQLYKQSRFFYENQLKHNWEKNRNLTELYGKTVCIAGAGSVGQAVAKLFSSFDCNIIGIDPYVKEQSYFDCIQDLNELDNALKESDIVILTLPLTEENSGFFNKEKFSIMKKNAIFVNIARGKLVNEMDLISSIQENQIGGAVLDVFEEEPLSPTSPLWDMENVIITPHNSFVGENNNKRLYQIVLNNFKKIQESNHGILF